MRIGSSSDEAFLVLGEDEERNRVESERRLGRSIPMRAFYAFTAGLALWVIAYGSGLVPWLGTAEIDETSGPGWTEAHGNLDFGIGTMLLFEGQIAFFDYESTSAESNIIFDVKPLTVLGYSPAMKRVLGVDKGRVEVKIARTGLYTFRHEPALGRRYGRTTYRVSWGAR